MFTLKAVTKESLEATRFRWQAQMSRRKGEILESRYLMILDWFDRIVEKNSGNTMAYALERDSSPGYACAMLELSHARPESDQPWLKVLSIHVEPCLDVAGDDAPITELAKIAAHAIVESLGLTFEQYPAKKLKVYAEAPLNRTFLEGIVGNITITEPFTITTHGNWLVIDKS